MRVEQRALVTQRWILERLRNRQFCTLAEFNGAINVLLVNLNNRPFQETQGLPVERLRIHWPARNAMSPPRRCPAELSGQRHSADPNNRNADYVRCKTVRLAIWRHTVGQIGSPDRRSLACRQTYSQ